MPTLTNKPASHTALKNVADEAAAFAARRTELASKHAAEEAELRDRQNAICAIQAPLNALLTQRAALAVRTETAKLQLARQITLQGEWQELMDNALGQPDAAHVQLAHLAHVFSDKFLAARLIEELQAFIQRRQAELGNLEAEVKAYAGQHSLEYMLPVDMGGQAPN